LKPENARFQAEHERIMQQMGIGTDDGPKSPELEEMMRCADAGNAACAYQAGIILSRRFSAAAEATSVLQSDAAAVRYLNQAAEAGIGLAMQSLGNKYQEGDGVRKNLRTSMDWLWKAALVGSTDAKETLDRICLLTKEIKAHYESLDNFITTRKLPPGASVVMPGPNLGTLLLELKPDLAARGFCLARPSHNHTGGAASPDSMSPIVGTDAMLRLDRTLERARARGNNIRVTYGRRGTENPEVTRQMLQGASDRRLIDNERFQQLKPVATGLCDAVTSADVESWKHSVRTLGIDVSCMHHGREAQRICISCVNQAIERLDAAARGAVALNLAEVVDDRGYLHSTIPGVASL